MKLTEDIKVVAVEYGDTITDIGAMAAKALPPGNRYRYCRPHTFILEDGRRVDGFVYGLTRPKLAERVAAEQQHIAAGCYWCSQWQHDGVAYWSTSLKMRVGPH